MTKSAWRFGGFSPTGKPVYWNCQWASFHRYFLKRKNPRGRTGEAFVFTAFLKERAPLVYEYVRMELAKDRLERDPRIMPILEEWRIAHQRRRKRLPSRREFAAFVIERALKGAWEVWRMQPPHTSGRFSTFYRRYVLGHRGAKKDFEKACNLPKPWEWHHVAHEMQWFLGPPGFGRGTL